MLFHVTWTIFPTRIFHLLGKKDGFLGNKMIGTFFYQLHGKGKGDKKSRITLKIGWEIFRRFPFQRSKDWLAAREVVRTDEMTLRVVRHWYIKLNIQPTKPEMVLRILLHFIHGGMNKHNSKILYKKMQVTWADSINH